MADTNEGVPLTRGLRPYVALSLLVFAVYAQTLTFGLTYLDDDSFLNQKFAFLSRWSNLPALFTHGSFLTGSGGEAYYRPLLTLSLMIDALLGGRSLVLFHFSNMLYHALATGLLYSLFRKTGHGDRSLLLAAIFAVHPVLAQAVAWMPGRTDTLLAVFLLASFNAFLDHLADRRIGSLLRHLLFFALALLVKELAIVLPALCLLYAVLNAPKGSLTLRLGAGWLLVPAAWFGVRRAVLSGDAGYSAVDTFASVWTNLPAAGLYWGKCVIPVKLSTYPILADASWMPGIAALVVLGSALALSRPVPPRTLLWGAAWFAVFLLPSFVYPADSITPVFFEYRAYLPLIGVLFILAETKALRTFPTETRQKALWAAVILVLAAGTVVNSRRYRDALPHWESSVEGSPSSAFAHKQLGLAHALALAPVPAEREYRAAIALNPREPGVHNNLGTLLLKGGRIDEAAEEYQRELSQNPRDAHALFNLGIVNLERGRRDDAAAFWRRTVEADPGFLDAYVNLAAYHALRKEPERAAPYAREAVRRGAELPPDLLKLLPP